MSDGPDWAERNPGTIRKVVPGFRFAQAGLRWLPNWDLELIQR